MKFIVVHEQEEEGCDYTIGCGVRVEAHEAASVDELLRKLEREAHEEWLNSDIDRATLTVYEVASQHEAPLDTWRRLKEELADAEVKKKEAKELAELERLRKKYPERA